MPARSALSGASTGSMSYAMTRSILATSLNEDDMFQSEQADRTHQGAGTSGGERDRGHDRLDVSGESRSTISTDSWPRCVPR
jgi:hypothetical protein